MREEAFEFRLFSAPQPGQQPAIQRIKISSPAPPPSSAPGGGFTNPRRPQSCYFSDPEKKKRYAQVAVSGAQVRERATRTRWVSFHHPPLPPSQSIPPKRSGETATKKSYIITWASQAQHFLGVSFGSAAQPQRWNAVLPP
jgi:hypothetical protein